MSTSLKVPDEKIAIRDYLEADEVLMGILGSDTHRVVLTLEDVKDDRHWLVLQRAGGRVEAEVPITRPLLYMIAYARTPWEAVRVMTAACNRLGLYSPDHNPQINGPFIQITDIAAESMWTEGVDNSVAGTNRNVPFVMQPVRLTAFREV